MPNAQTQKVLDRIDALLLAAPVLWFALVIKDVQTGFLADPIYGGNRDMAAWKMIGFPGARYNYLDWVGRHNEPYPLPPVSMIGRAEWTSNNSGAR